VRLGLAALWLALVLVGGAAAAGEATAPQPAPAKEQIAKLTRTYLSRLPGVGTVRLASVEAAPPASAETKARGVWLSLTSSARGPVPQLLARWESRLLIAAVWRKSGSSRAVVSGGSLTVSAPSPGGADADTSVAFGKNAANYFRDAENKPSSLTVPRRRLVARIRAAAPTMHVTIDSVRFFSLLGTDVVVRATAPDAASLNLNAAPFGDPGRLEGACMIIRDPSGHLLYRWSYATGVQTGEGGGPGGIGPDGTMP